MTLVADLTLWLILGLLAGGVAVLVVHRAIPGDLRQIAGALVVGLAGGGLGGWLSDLVGLRAVSWLGSLLLAFAGAWLILQVLRRLGWSPGGTGRGGA